MNRLAIITLFLFAFSTNAFSNPSTSFHIHKTDIATSGIQVVPSDKFCKPIIDSVAVIKDEFRTTVSMRKVIFLKTPELACFNDFIRKEARSPKTINRILRECVNYPEFCQDLRTNLPSLNN